MPRHSDRENPEGISISKKTAGGGGVSKPTPPAPTMKTRKSRRGAWAGGEEGGGSPLKRKDQSGDSSGFYDLTPQSLSQISAIAPPEDSTMRSPHKKSRMAPGSAMEMGLHSPPKKSRMALDVTMEMAVRRARGQPDGADQSGQQSPRKKSSKKLLGDIAEEGMEEERGTVKEEKENSTMMAQKKCIKIPLKQVGKKLKSFKTSSAKNKVSTKVKKNFDRTLPNETMVPKKPKQSWADKRKERRMVKNNYQLIQTAKSVWEDLRRHDQTEEQRSDLCQNLFTQVEGKVKPLSVVHDSARIIQCLVQYGGPHYRSCVLDEIQDVVADFSKNKYAKFIIRKLLKYGTKAQRATIIQGFQGSVRKLIRHKQAAEIVEYAYNEFATASQRLCLVEEFYGPAFSMFKTHTAQSLDDVLKEQWDKKDMIMSNLKESLLPLIDKQILSLSIVHKIFSDFFKYADPKLQKDMIEALRESLIHMLHTKEGTRTAMACVWAGSAKDRKMIIKSFKGHVTQICKEEAGHMMLLAIFDCVDDTVLVQKALLDEIMKNLGKIIADSHGRKVLTYLLVRRDHSFFCPDVIRILEQGDSTPTSKKDPEVRAEELRSYVSEPLLSFLTDNAALLLTNSHSSLMVPLILAHAKGDTSSAVEALAAVVVTTSDPTHSGESTGGDKDRPMSLVEDPAGHMTLKKILLTDRQKMHQGKEGLFCVALSNMAEPSIYKSWVVSNRGCFMLVMLLEVENASVTHRLLSQLTPLKKYLRKMTFKGAEILLNKMEQVQPGTHGKRPVEISL